MPGYLYILLPLLLFIIFCIFNTKFKIFIKERLSEILSAIGGIGMSIAKFMSNDERIFIANCIWKEVSFTLFIIFSFFIIISIYITHKRNKHNKNIEDLEHKNNLLLDEIENYSKEYAKLCNDTILNLFNSFFTSGNDRISIYKHQGDHFTLLSRYSKNPEFNRLSEHSYSDNDGIISEGWKNGESEIKNAPKWTGKGQDYKSFMKEKCKITDKRLKQIKMKSRSLYIKTLNDTGTAENPDGVIVFESLVPDKAIRDKCLNLIETNERELLRLLKHMKSLTKKKK